MAPNLPVVGWSDVRCLSYEPSARMVNTVSIALAAASGYFIGNYVQGSPPHSWKLGGMVSRGWW